MTDNTIVFPALGDLIFSKGFCCHNGMIFMGKDRYAIPCASNIKYKEKNNRALIITFSHSTIKCSMRIKRKFHGLMALSAPKDYCGKLKISNFPYTGSISTTYKIDAPFITISFGKHTIELTKDASNRYFSGYQIICLGRPVIQLKSVNFYDDLNFKVLFESRLGFGKTHIGNWVLGNYITVMIRDLEFLLPCLSMLILYSVLLPQIDTDIDVSS